MKRELLALVCVLIALAQAAPTLDYTNHTVELGSVFTAAFNISTANQALFRVQRANCSMHFLTFLTFDTDTLPSFLSL